MLGLLRTPTAVSAGRLARCLSLRSLAGLGRLVALLLGEAADCPRKTGSAVLRRANHRDPVAPPYLPGGKAGSSPPPAGFQQRVDMGGPAWERCQADSDRREILREHRAEREPRRDPAPVSLPRRQRRQRAAAAAPGAGIGAAAARRRDRDRSRTGRRPDRRDHARRNGAPPCRPVLPRRRVRPGRRLPGRRPGRADRPADARQGHLRGLPARPRAPVSGRSRRRPGRLPRPPAGRHRPVRHRLRRRVRRRRARRRHPGQRSRSRAAPARPRPSSCHRTPT